eukprot:m.257124 g.257124  ORF g.257124 m.257124 type:complete len:84 (+) comp35001_c0_seq1:27-278(+)
MASTYTMAEVATNNTAQNCWIVVDGGVYNVTEFLEDHPGGKRILVKSSGKDASKEFYQMHKASVLTKYAEEYKIGTVAGGSKL